MKYTIKVPKPCSEKWSEMTPTARGAYCSNCQKEVLDFTGKSNQEIERLVKQSKNPCGKFRQEQLNVPILSAQNNKVSQIGFFLGISSLLTLATPSYGQDATPKTFETQQFEKVKRELHKIDKPNDSIRISGVVSDTHYPLPGVNIHLMGTHYGTQTDYDGNFSLSVSKTMLKANPILIVSFIGFETEEIGVNETTGFLNIEMKDNGEVVTTGMVVVERQSIFRRIGNLFKKKHKESCDE